MCLVCVIDMDIFIFIFYILISIFSLPGFHLVMSHKVPHAMIIRMAKLEAEETWYATHTSAHSHHTWYDIMWLVDQDLILDPMNDFSPCCHNMWTCIERN